MNVNDWKRPYIWLPGQKPFSVFYASKLTIKCDESNKMYAHKVVENVPHFKEKVTLTNGLVTAHTPEELQQRAEEEVSPDASLGSDASNLVRADDHIPTAGSVSSHKQTDEAIA